jgi:hypothetical protein
MRHLESLHLCRHLCECVKKIVQHDKALEHTHVYDPLWANPFWYVETFKKAHSQPSRTHAVNILHLEQNTLLPPVNLKEIKNHGRYNKKRHMSKGEDGMRILRKDEELKRKADKTKYSTSKKCKTTTDIVLHSKTFRQIQVRHLTVT